MAKINTTVYDELVNNGDVLPTQIPFLLNNYDSPQNNLWYKSLDTFTMPQIEEDHTGNMLDKFADFMSINANAAKDTDYNFCVTCGSACVMTNDGYECQNCGVVKHSVGDFKDVHDDSMKILNFGGRKLYSIVDYSKTQKKNVLGQLLQLNDNKPSKYNRTEISMTPVAQMQQVPKVNQVHQVNQVHKSDENLNGIVYTEANLVIEENKQSHENFSKENLKENLKDNMPDESAYDFTNNDFTKETNDVLSDSVSTECAFNSVETESETPKNGAFYELSANSAPTVITRDAKRQQTTVTICESSVVSTANSLQEPSIRFPKAILEKAADYYNMIQKVSIDQIDTEGKVCGQKRIVRRGDVKDEVIGYCIYCACVEMGMPRKEKEIAKFMRIKNNGLSRGKNFVRKLYCAGKINIPALDIDANDYYVKRYLTNLKLYNEEPQNNNISMIGGANSVVSNVFTTDYNGMVFGGDYNPNKNGIFGGDYSPNKNSIFGGDYNPAKNSIFAIYKNYLDAIPNDSSGDEKQQQNQHTNNNKFVLKLVEESTRLGVGNNSNHISKIVGSIWVLICHLDLAADETLPRKKSEKQKNAKLEGFSYDKMYSKQIAPLIMNYEQAMHFASIHSSTTNNSQNVEIIWPNGQENDKSLQFVAIFAGIKHILVAGSLFGTLQAAEKQPRKSKTEKESALESPKQNDRKITLTDLENACDGIRKNTFLKFSKCIEDNILLFIDVFNEFGIPHKVKGKLIKRKKNTKGIVNQLYNL